MTENKKRWGRILKAVMIILPITVGVAAFIIMSKYKKPPKQKNIILDIPTVRVMEVKPVDVEPRVLGYGTAQPIRIWKAVAQVNGKIIYTHPQLQKGSIIRQGAELLRIDPTEYKINAGKIRASIQNIKFQIQQLRIEEKNNKRLLELHKTDLEIRRKEVDRQEQLYKKKISSKTEYEKQLQSYISQEVQVQNFQNSLNLFPIRLEIIQTQLAQAKSDLESANLQLAYTTISAPYDIQIARIDSKISEFVQAGRTILEANDISVMEIEAQVAMKAMMPIFMSVKDKAGDVDLTAVSIGDALGIKSKVRLAGDAKNGIEWSANFNRRSDTLDSETRTLGLIVAVKNNLNQQGIKRGGLLLSGAYCEVELRGLVQKNRIVIPRNAIHPGNVVLLKNSENKLVKKRVSILYSMGDIAVIEDGVKAGDVLILSDVIPAIDGMVVDPVIDAERTKKMNVDAKGEKP